MDISPTLPQFKKLAKKHNLIVFSTKFYADWLTPLSIYYGLSKTIRQDSFLLESVDGAEKICRFSFLGVKPLCIFKSKGRMITISRPKRAVKFQTKHDPLFELKKLMQTFRVAPKENIRFFGGFVGYAGYDLVRFYEPVGPPLPDPLKTYDTYFVLPQFLIIFDHRTHQIEVLSFVSLAGAKNLPHIYAREKKALQRFCRKVLTPHRLPDLTFTAKKLSATSNFGKSDFLAAVKKAKQHIKEGDVIQVVLSQRFAIPFKGDPLTTYRYLRILNPSPYMFYLRCGGIRVVGSSPEMLLRCEQFELITRPIAGTRKRAKTEQKDSALEADLLSDPKEKAEHIMLVDLARNDLGRVCERNTVSVPIFMQVERFSHVMHIVSEVRARLAKRETIFSALAGCFPAGTVSGAPKVRAMQIINELEPEKRGIYAGSVGYFSFTNSLDTCIIIRTIVFAQGYAYIQAGAGIVADSVPLREYNETVNKAKAQMLALGFS